VVQTANAGTVTVPFAEVETIRSQHEQQLYEGSQHPSLTQNWNGGASLGFALARGNSDTTNLNIGMTATRTTISDQILMHFSSVYATNNVPGGGVSANAIFAGIRYDRNLTAKLFAFAAADFTHNALQFLNLRQIYSGGLGWHAIKTEKTTFDVLGGVNYTRETYGAGTTATGPTTGVNRNLPGLTAGETFMHKFGEATVLTEDFTFYPELSDLSQYRFAFDTSATTKIHRWLGWQISINDQYVSNPPILGTKSNDVILTTGLNVTFDTTPK
jgi:putative salt-induced outer membrane protein